MNRNFISVIFGGWGTATGPQLEVEGEMVSTDVNSVAAELKEASSIIIVPGYGMAVAQAQAAVSELVRRLRSAGKSTLCHSSCCWSTTRSHECIVSRS